MPYSQKQWQDRIKDSQGNIVQEGTPFSAGNMNRMEQGIADAHAQLEEAARQKQTLIHGVSVLNGGVDAPVNIEIEGRTLIPMQNTVLDPLKYYVLADKRTKAKFADGTILSGIAKFTAKAERPTLIRVANYENKISGSALENPHIMKSNNGGQNSTLVTPTTLSTESTTSAASVVAKQDGVVLPISTAVGISGAIAQTQFSFNLIEEVERQLGRIPRSTVASKIQWIKDNLNSLKINWYGYGVSAGGSKATLVCYSTSTSAWVDNVSHTNSTAVTRLGNTLTTAQIANRVDDNGFIHFLAYAEPANSTTVSTISTDYIDLEIELKPDAILHDPRVPLYEVTKEHYDAINVTMLEDEVLHRYPSVEGVTHLQNPYIMAEGENLLPPVSEWALQTTAKIESDYKMGATSSGSYAAFGSITYPVSVGATYTISKDEKDSDDASVYVRKSNINGALVATVTKTGTTFTVDSSYGGFIHIYAVTKNEAGKYNTLENPMLTLGDKVKPFKPRNASYALFETKLGKIGDVADRLYEQDAKYFKRKVIEDVVLDGSLAWVFESSKTGYKVFRVNGLLNVPNLSYYQLVTSSKYNGKALPNLPATSDFADGDQLHVSTSPSAGSVKISIFNQDTGLAENRTPTNDEVKAYFNGWKVKTTDPTTFVATAWVSIVDGTDAPTQTLDYVKANKAPNYTPYKLSYVLANPRSEEIKSEGAISVNGLTQIEVGSGVVVREKVTPLTSSDSGFYHLNNETIGSIPSNKFKNRLLKLLSVYKNNTNETAKWATKTNYAYGLNRFELPKSDFDTTAEYTVTYLVFDRQPFTSNPVNVSAQFANNVRSALEDTTKKVEDNTTAISVNTNILYDVLKRLKAGGL